MYTGFELPHFCLQILTYNNFSLFISAFSLFPLRTLRGQPIKREKVIKNNFLNTTKLQREFRVVVFVPYLVKHALLHILCTSRSAHVHPQKSYCDDKSTFNTL